MRIPLEKEDEKLMGEALRIVDEAKKRGIVLRLMGGIAVIIHTDDSSLYTRLTTPGSDGGKSRDIDMVTYSSQSSKVDKLFNDLSYNSDKLVMAYFGENRFMYHHPKDIYYVDVFFEKLHFSHDMNLGSKKGRGRLELDYPTLTLADLILGKLQIHEINEKDIRDLIILIKGHSLSDDDVEESINLERIASVLSNDWGFWYDAESNLNKVLKSTEKYRIEGLLSEEEFDDLSTKVQKISIYINKIPKSKDWLKRAKEGSSKKWWNDVEELVR